MRRLANKEQEFQDYVSQIAEYKAQQAPTALALRTALLDPAVNLLFERLKKELKATKAKLEETQNELSAWKFTPDSNTGKRLMAKCRLLYQENEELGKMTSNGRLAKLETELAMQKSFSEEVKKSQSELDDFLQELDEDVEGMQSTILFLQQELKTTRDRIQTLEKENVQLKQTSSSGCSSSILKEEPAMAVVPANTNGTVNSNEYNNISSSETTATTTSTPATITTLTTANKLETIEEHACMEAPATNLNGSNNNEQPASTAAADEHILPDDGSNSNGSKNGTNTVRLARKRNYEEDVSITAPINYTIEESAVPPVALREVSAPRTLPPKKSKLRGITTRPSTQLEEEQSPAVLATPLLGVVPENVEDAPAPAPAAEAAATSSLIVGEAIDAIAAAVSATTTTPARILTRRRSVRMQQNGSSVDY